MINIDEIKKSIEGKNQSDELFKYEIVHKSETFEDLKTAIEIIGESSTIQGTKRIFKTDEMLRRLELVNKDIAPFNYLTRAYNIRQQAMYIKHYAQK